MVFVLVCSWELCLGDGWVILLAMMMELKMGNQREFVRVGEMVDLMVDLMVHAMEYLWAVLLVQ